MANVDPSEQAIKELGLPTYSDLHARVKELEAALRDVREYLDEIGDYPEPREAVERIDAVLRKIDPLT